MTTAKTRETEFLTALADFERCLETPVVPGELPNWLRTVRQASMDVRVQLKREIDETHNQLLDDMVEQDFELAPRAQEMKDADHALISRLEELQKTFDRLAEMAERAEPHEAKLDEHVEQFTNEALQFVIECRKHENALTTWYMEAFNRDRGIAD